tara:strand:+ start:318 stop:479 length:162 start_codon:yes stop_codon:yes gene_type:complete
MKLFPGGHFILLKLIFFSLDFNIFFHIFFSYFFLKGPNLENDFAGANCLKQAI